jgi:hypothetical protein
MHDSEEYDIKTIILVLGVVLVAFAVVPVYFGYLSSGTGSVVASSLLVLVTTVYAYQAYKNAEYTQATLDEMEKDREKHGRVLTIAYGIDPIRDKLQSYCEDWTRSGRGCYPKLTSEWGLPDDEVISDIEEVYPEFEDDFEDFLDALDAYGEKWYLFHGDLEDKIIEDHPERLQEYVEENEGEEVSSVLASYALNPEGPFGHSELHRELQSDLAMLRGDSVFGDVFDDIEVVYNQLIDENKEFCENLDEAREELKSEYGITDLEIEEVKKQSSLEDPDIIVRSMV